MAAQYLWHVSPIVGIGNMSLLVEDSTMESGALEPRITGNKWNGLSVKVKQDLKTSLSL